jgi:hypothetical protein
MKKAIFNFFVKGAEKRIFPFIDPLHFGTAFWVLAFWVFCIWHDRCIQLCEIKKVIRESSGFNFFFFGFLC